MQPFEGSTDEVTYIDLGQEIELIRKRLLEMGESVETTTKPVEEFQTVNHHAIAAHKIKAAKKRKQKRKSGGPR